MEPNINSAMQNQTQSQQPTLPSKNSGKGFLLLGGLALIVVVGAMLYYIMTPKSSPLTYPPVQSVVTPVKQAAQVSEEQQLENLDTGDPAMDLLDLEKDLASL